MIPVLSAAILTPLIASSLAAASSSAKLSPTVKDALPKFYRYLAGVSGAAERDQQDLAVQAYVALLRTPYARATFWDMAEETMGPLVKLVGDTARGTTAAQGNAASNNGVVQGGVPLQLVYHVLLVVWQLTFDTVVAEEINKYHPSPLPALRRPMDF